jgi:carbonic anhydrase
MNHTTVYSTSTLSRDVIAGFIVFLVALPLCLGIALASGAPLFAGLIAGIVGGILIGLLSGSHTSVSGPAAGLATIVAAQIAGLGSFRTFLLAIVVAGVLQVVLGIVRAGSLSAFFPSSVIKGLLAAIGTILIIKQIPYLLGYDMIPKVAAHGHSNIWNQLEKLFTGNVHAGALAIGGVSLAILFVWDRIKVLKNSLMPGQLVAVIAGVLLGFGADLVGAPWVFDNAERFMVQVPVAQSLAGFLDFLTFPDFSQWANPAVYVAGLTLATVASLETLLNLDAVDKLDKKQRHSPPSRELWAQGVGNIASGLLGGLPITSVVIRGSVNVGAGSATKISAIFHGLMLFLCVLLVPTWLNKIPLSCLAAILIMTGFKLASPKVMTAMWREGASQFVPFIVTLLAIVATDLLIGIAIGFGFSLLFILASSLKLPIRQIVERHVGGEVLHIELANQVSFLNRAALERVLREAPSGSHLLLDARRTDYIDPDILSLIREFKEITAPANGVQVSLRGFKSKYRLQDNIQFVDYTTRELQSQLTPALVLKILAEGNERFRTGKRLDRDLRIAAAGDARKEHPMAVVFSGTDPRTPAELVFDLGLGDVYSIRMAGNVIGPNAIGSMEYGCIVGGAKLILVMGHTQSGLVELAIRESCLEADARDFAHYPNLAPILSQIKESIDVTSECRRYSTACSAERKIFVNEISRRNVERCVQQVLLKSPAIRQLVDEQKLAIVGAMLDTDSGSVEFLAEAANLYNSHSSNGHLEAVKNQ